MEQRAVIDETFAGLVAPVQAFEMGRTDIEEGRPGAVLVEEVRAFEAEGGFRKIAEDREAGRVADEKADAGVARPKMRHADIGIVAKDVDVPAASESHKD
jgi:hypothetical protein